MTVRHIDREKCIACGRCFLICPMDVFGRLGRHVFIAHPRECMTCYLCEFECPTEAVFVGPERGMEKVLPYHVGDGPAKKQTGRKTHGIGQGTVPHS